MSKINANEKYQTILLLLSAIGLTPVALSYGVVPTKTLTPLYGISMDNLNLIHIMRAVMGLYLGQIFFWLMGVFNPKLKLIAVYSMVVFMLGLAAGRLLSIVIDGIPHWLLLAYLFLELLSGITGIILIFRANASLTKNS